MNKYSTLQKHVKMHYKQRKKATSIDIQYCILTQSKLTVLILEPRNEFVRLDVTSFATNILWQGCKKVYIGCAFCH